MRHLGFTIAFLAILGWSSAAPDRVKRQVDTSLVDQCREIFNVSCESLGISSTGLPPLSRATVPTTDTSDCNCVPYYQCHSDGTANTDGVTIIDRRISPCPGSVEVCCQPTSLIPDTGTGGTGTGGTGTGGTGTGGTGTGGTGTGGTGTGGTGTGGTGTGGTGTGETGTGIDPHVPRPTQPIPNIPVKPGCGHRNSGGIVVRITGTTENEAQFAEFPWMVAVLQKPRAPATQSQYTCGGSLIHPRVILTAAHTIEKKRPSDLLIRAGEWDTQTLSEPIPYQERDVEAIIIHENYNTNNLHWDFALLILKTPFDVAPNVNTICLPDESAVFDAARCTATGWGKDKFEQSGKYQAVLKRIELPVVPNTPCQTFLRLTRLGKAFILDPSFICAGGEPGRDTCTGDGGSPLACPIANSVDRYVQSGIVAWGISCGDDRTPGVYASVPKARRWIDSKMAQYNLDTSSYLA